MTQNEKRILLVKNLSNDVIEDFLRDNTSIKKNGVHFDTIEATCIDLVKEFLIANKIIKA
jgi:hypothetical protein